MRVIVDEKGNKYLSRMLKVLKTFPFSSSQLFPFSPQNVAIAPLSDGCTLPIGEKLWKTILEWKDHVPAEHQKISQLCILHNLATDHHLKSKCWRRNSLRTKELFVKLSLKDQANFLTFPDFKKNGNPVGNLSYITMLNTVSGMLCEMVAAKTIF